MTPTFIGVDGDSVGQGDDARYAVLCSSDAGPLVDLEGLRTRRMLDYLLDLQEPKAEVVCYGLNYHVNQWLVDIDDRYLRELYATGNISWRGYRIEWTPARFLKITHRASGRWVAVQEVFGFFQTSFLGALEAWDVPEPPRALVPPERGDYTPEHRRTLTQARQRDAHALVDLMGLVADAASVAGVTPWPHTWIGAGACAGTLLRNNDIARHHRHDADLAPPEALPAIMTAYLGGRSEVYRQGVSTHISTYDVRSAYPASARHLPSLAGATLVARRRYDPNAQHAIWRVQWRNAPGIIMPLPVRSEEAIWWPQTGSGWYHAVEVAAVLAAGFQVRVGEGWVLQSRGRVQPERPFRFLDDTYRQRQVFEAESHPGARILKLATNSIYGKLAQGHGRAKLPRWQSFFWAGELTAHTRAHVLTTLLAAHRPVMVATDGIFAASTPARASSTLGGWKIGGLDWMFAAQPGVYQAFDGNREVLRSSGFFSQDISYEELREGWERDGVDSIYAYQSRRFIGLGIALARERVDEWRTWRDEARAIHLRPRRKDTAYADDGDGIILYPKPRAPGDSEPYVRKQRLLDSRDEDNEQGMDQPLHATI